MKTTNRWIGMGLLFAVIGTSAPAVRASECGMGEDIDWYASERVKVSDAAALLDAGQERDAAWMIQSTWPRMHEARPVASSLQHIADAVRVMALACVRTGGDVRPGLGWTSTTAAERAANVRWGLSRLEMLSAANPDDPYRKVDLAEALARAPETEKRAKDILEDLDGSGVILSAEGFSVLSRLRLERGDEAGAAEAVERCMTFNGAVDRCAPPVTLEASAPTAAR